MPRNASVKCGPRYFAMTKPVFVVLLDVYVQLVYTTL